MRAPPLVVGLVAAAALAAAGCGGGGPKDVVLVTHDSFAVSAAVEKAFEQESGLRLRILKAGDAGEVVTRALLTAGDPEGDVLFGVDNNLLARTLAASAWAVRTQTRFSAVPLRILRTGHERRIAPYDLAALHDDPARRSALAEALKRAGARRVEVWAVARAVGYLDAAAGRNPSR